VFAAIPSAALAAPGDLDPTFGSGGKVTTAIGGGDDQAYAVAVQADGKIVAAGNCWTASYDDFCLARYSSDGGLDTSFDGDGKVTTDSGYGYDVAYAVAVQADGKIVAAGNCWTASYDDFCLARYNGDGSLDTSFGGDGKVTTAIGSGYDVAYAVAVQADGKIVAAGSCETSSTDDFCLARYSSDGSLDTSFDGDGKVNTHIRGDDIAAGVAVQADGRIVAAGTCLISSNWGFCLARYSSDGSLDTTFDGDGKVTTAFSSEADLGNTVAVQADGKIVAAGECNVDTTPGPGNGVFCLARYNSDGSLDTSFDGDGKVTTDISSRGDGVVAVAVQADGKIVAAGGCKSVFCLARYNGNGSLDTSFGGGGKVITAIGTDFDRASAVVVQADGRIVAAGGCSSDSNWDYCLARYEGTPTVPATVPGPPTLTTAAGGNSSVSLGWSAPGSDGGSAVTGYRVYRGTSAGGETLLVAPVGTGTSYTDSTAVNGTTYFYKVSAVNVVGEGGLSNELSAVPAAFPTVPVAPSGLTAAALSRSLIGLVWSDNAANETGFRIERSFDGSSGWRQVGSVAANATTYLHWRHWPLTTSYYRVRATNAAGHSTYSNVASATTLG
jgi:uncharacterized delta-60 repeat protein